MVTDDVAVIKDRLAIEDVVGQHVTLKKSGRNMSGLCPFHREKTPSFVVSPDRGTFKCFGCGMGGDMLSFVMEINKLSFPEALEILADKAGVTLSKSRGSSGKDKKEREQLVKVLEVAVTFWQNKLQDNQLAKEYLAKRKVNPATIDKWQLGFAPDAWDELYQMLHQKKFSDAQIKAAGLCKPGKKKGYIDVFRNRIQFPITNARGVLVGATGRVLGDAQPKYLNTPETLLFKKSQVLYGVDKAISAITRSKYIILVEGQMDVILMHQAGIKNVVATSGTAVTEEHIRQLKRYSKNLLLVLDGDQAGMNATLKLAHLAIPEGCTLKVVSLQSGEDPASLISKDEKDNLLTQLKSAKKLPVWLAEYYKKQPDSQQSEILEQALQLFIAIPKATEQELAVAAFATEIGVRPESLLADMADMKAKMTVPASTTVKAVKATEVENAGTVHQEQADTQRALHNVVRMLLSDDLSQEMKKFIEDRLKEVVPREYLEKVKQSIAATEPERISGFHQAENRDEYLQESMFSLEKKLLERRRKLLQKKIGALEKEIDSVDKNALQKLDKTTAKTDNSKSVNAPPEHMLKKVIDEWQDITRKLASLHNLYYPHADN